MNIIDNNKSYSFKTILIIGILACSFLFLIFITIFKYTLKQIYEARCNKIKAAGEPVSLKELKKYYGKIPDEENAAMIYEDMFSLYKDDKQVYEMYLKQITAKGIIEAEREFKTEREFEENILFTGYDLTLISNNQLPEKIKNATRIFLKANEECIKLARKTELYSKCRFNLDFSLGEEKITPHLYASRDISKLLITDMIYSSFNNDSERVLRDFKETMKLGLFIRNEPTFNSLATGIFIDILAIDGLRECFPQIQFNDLQLKEIESILKKHINSFNAYRAYIGQRAFIFNKRNELYKLLSISKFDIKINPVNKHHSCTKKINCFIIYSVGENRVDNYENSDLVFEIIIKPEKKKKQ